jgi:SAM-dependent methyltransferase
MIDIELEKFEKLTLQWAENQIGEDENREGVWDPDWVYLKLPEWHRYSLTNKAERRFLGWISERLLPGSLIVEVGSFLGVSAAIMAHYNSKITIKAVDHYDTNNSNIQQHYINTYGSFFAELLGPNQPRSRECLSNIWKQYPNIEFVAGNSPVDFIQTNWGPVDVYFEDSTHENPILAENINHWKSMVKPGGLILCHDYRPNLSIKFDYRHIPAEQRTKLFPDVNAEVQKLIEQGYKLEGTVGTIAILRKPGL